MNKHDRRHQKASKLLPLGAAYVVRSHFVVREQNTIFSEKEKIMINIPKVSSLDDSYFEDYQLTNLDDLCMNYIRDSSFELSNRGYETRDLDTLIDYFENRYNWWYNPNAEGYTLFNVNTGAMSEVDHMHELTLANKCLNTLLVDELITDKQYRAIHELYQRAYNDCIKVLCGGWRRGEPHMTVDLVPYNELCEQQNVINESNKTRLCSIYD